MAVIFPPLWCLQLQAPCREHPGKTGPLSSPVLRPRCLQVAPRASRGCSTAHGTVSQPYSDISKHPPSLDSFSSPLHPSEHKWIAGGSKKCPRTALHMPTDRRWSVVQGHSVHWWCHGNDNRAAGCCTEVAGKDCTVHGKQPCISLQRADISQAMGFRGMQKHLRSIREIPRYIEGWTLRNQGQQNERP